VLRRGDVFLKAGELDKGDPAASPAMSAMPLKAEVNSEQLTAYGQLLRLDGIAVDVIQAPKPGASNHALRTHRL
jgi:hypothetical protein